MKHRLFSGTTRICLFTFSVALTYLRLSPFTFSMFHVDRPFNTILMKPLSSLRAESARAVTGRRCPHSGEGEDFLTGQLNFFTETAVTPERKVEKSIPR